MNFKTSKDLAKWMREQDKASNLTGELKVVANAVLGQWRIIERRTKAKKTIDARSARFFREAHTRLSALIASHQDREG